MTRRSLKVPDEDVLAELHRVTCLFQEALPDSGSRFNFDSLMNEAASQGMDWVHALEYVVEQRVRSRPSSRISSILR